MQSFFQKVLICAAASLILVANGAWSSVDGDWELKKDSGGIAVYSQDVADSDINVIRAEAEIDVPLDVLLDLLMQADLKPTWNSICHKASVVGEGGSDTVTEHIYLQYDMPWPVADRDVVMSQRVERSDNTVTISASAIVDIVPVDKKYVRVSKAWEEWVLTRRADDKVHLRMTAFMDPAGPIPAWLINAMSVSQPYEIMENLRSMSLSRYQGGDASDNQ